MSLRNRFCMFYNLPHMKAKLFLGRILFLFLFLFFHLNPYLLNAAILLDRVVALVNKEVITWSELYQLMEKESLEDLKALDEEKRMEIFKKSEHAFLEKLIDIRLQIQEAKRLGIEASPEDVDEAIENIKKKYSLSTEQLEASLDQEGLTFEEYKKRLSEQIMMSKLVNQQVRSKIIVSDEEVNDYYNKVEHTTGSQESYKLRQIFFNMPENDDMKKEVEERASNIIEKLKEGEDFSRLAQEYSEDPSAKLGGDLGYIQKKFLTKEFIDVLSDMKIGDSSMPFWTQQGLHIVKLEDKTSAQTDEDSKKNIKEKLLEEKFLKTYESWIKSLRDGAHIVIRL
jgi:peptidyl-prolyl cis-trans isomerase SurA